jgi:hypothetical protein
MKVTVQLPKVSTSGKVSRPMPKVAVKGVGKMKLPAVTMVRISASPKGGLSSLL